MPDVTKAEQPKPSVAYWWLGAAATAALTSLILFVLVLEGHSELVWPGRLALAALGTCALRQFTETHWRYYHRWPAGWALFWTGTAERREVAEAWRRRNAIREVELSRLLGIGLFGLAFGGFVVLFAFRPLA